jgi:aspartate racemase
MPLSGQMCRWVLIFNVTHHVGIIGCSPPGAALCAELICTQASELARGSNARVEVSMHCHAFSEYMRHIDADDWTGVSELMLSSAHKLASIGAEFLLAPCNTIHRVFDLVTAQSPRPWLHIAAQVAAECKRRGFRRVALLGTSHRRRMGLPHEIGSYPAAWWCEIWQKAAIALYL